jgi:hypothetical protein
MFKRILLIVTKITGKTIQAQNTMGVTNSSDSKCCATGGTHTWYNK